MPIKRARVRAQAEAVEAVVVTAGEMSYNPLCVLKTLGGPWSVREREREKAHWKTTTQAENEKSELKMKPRNQVWREATVIYLILISFFHAAKLLSLVINTKIIE